MLKPKKRPPKSKATVGQAKYKIGKLSKKDKDILKYGNLSNYLRDKF
jgi:hypothetical protein